MLPSFYRTAHNILDTYLLLFSMLIIIGAITMMCLINQWMVSRVRDRVQDRNLYKILKQ